LGSGCGGLITVKSAIIDHRARDAYWHATRNELKSAQRRGDVLILAGAVALLALVAFNREKAGELTWWLVGGSLLLAIIAGSLWFVTKRRRRIAATRGLVCAQCAYVPHDTEITEVADTRLCPRCGQSLEH
jgi:hypothetical protein